MDGGLGMEGGMAGWSEVMERGMEEWYWMDGWMDGGREGGMDGWIGWKDRMV